MARVKRERRSAEVDWECKCDSVNVDLISQDDIDLGKKTVVCPDCGRVEILNLTKIEEDFNDVVDRKIILNLDSVYYSLPDKVKLGDLPVVYHLFKKAGKELNEKLKISKRKNELTKTQAIKEVLEALRLSAQYPEIFGIDSSDLEDGDADSFGEFLN